MEEQHEIEKVFKNNNNRMNVTINIPKIRVRVEQPPRPCPDIPVIAEIDGNAPPTPINGILNGGNQ